MVEIREEISLKSYNSFGLIAKAARFISFSSESELLLALKDLEKENEILILGGGTNILFCQDYEGLVIRNGILGIDIIRENDHRN